MTERIKEFSLASVHIFPARNLIRSERGDFPLEPRIMEVLVELSLHAREVLTRTYLVNELWKIEFGGDESLTRAISQLRKTFKAAGLEGDFIQTIPKRGYRLVLVPDYTPNPPLPKPKKSYQSPAKSNPTQTLSHDLPQPKKTTDKNTTKPPSTLQNVTFNKTTKRPKTYKLPLFLAGILALSVGYNLTSNRVSLNSYNFGKSSRISSQAINSSQAELAIAIIFTYLNGQIDKDQAIQSATPHIRLAELDPAESSTTYTAKGWLAVLQMRDADALSSFDNAILKDPLQAKAWLGKAYVFHQREDYALSLSMVDQAINIDALLFFSRLLRLNILIDMGEPAKAKLDLNQLTTIHGNHPDLDVFQGILKDIE